MPDVPAKCRPGKTNILMRKRRHNNTKNKSEKDIGPKRNRETKTEKETKIKKGRVASNSFKALVPRLWSVDSKEIYRLRNFPGAAPRETAPPNGGQIYDI